MMRFILLGLAMALVAGSAKGESTQEQFFNNLLAICGHSYLGKVVESNETDINWRQSEIVIHAPACTNENSEEIRIPLHVGANTSRTWIISKTNTGLRLKHDHRNEDGSPDDVTMYGGDTANAGTANVQAFPVDDYSKDLFVEHGLDVSTTNTWTLSIEPGKTLSYRLSRPGRLFEVSFNLSNPIK